MAATSFRALVALCLVALLQCTAVLAWSMPSFGGGGLVALAPRQSPNAGAGAAPGSGTVVTCADYSRVANMSIIGLNSTLRGAFLRSAPHGTDAASALLDTQSPKLPAYQFNAALNAQCGNLTTVAFQGADLNLTRGIVAEFTIVDAPGIGVDGITTLVICSAIVMFMGITLMTME
ncbi:hypothetical protein Micbo1qcDRAFT_165615 [Microdochium bolleyi]|uniref:Uncharacterized protein n=1 Tax=Microdochium bolleyi TaxID=196109 RepID=A0A136IWW6_9PEZI|nr:hypothetical protein Micbo1qcDRAFT_165615 [Microdochium bolleyi]